VLLDVGASRSLHGTAFIATIVAFAFLLFASIHLARLALVTLLVRSRAARMSASAMTSGQADGRPRLFLARSLFFGGIVLVVLAIIGSLTGEASSMLSASVVVIGAIVLNMVLLLAIIVRLRRRKVEDTTVSATGVSVRVEVEGETGLPHPASPPPPRPSPSLTSFQASASSSLAIQPVDIGESITAFTCRLTPPRLKSCRAERVSTE